MQAAPLPRVQAPRNIAVSQLAVAGRRERAGSWEAVIGDWRGVISRETEGGCRKGKGGPGGLSLTRNAFPPAGESLH